MKKRVLSIILIGSLLITSLAGCENTGRTTSIYESTVNTELAIHRRKEDYSDVNEACADLIEIYYDGIKTKDYDKAFSVFPDFFVKANDAYIDALQQTKKEFMEDNYQWYSINIGSDFKIELKINKVLQLVDSILLERQNTINKTFGVNIKLDDCYSVETTENASGSITSESNVITWYILEIDGEYFLYENFFDQPEESE